MFGGTNRAIQSGWNRLYANFLMPSRLGEYELLLQSALDRGYKTHSILSFWQLIQQAQLRLAGSRHLVLRHDVDTDPPTAESMWRVEVRLGVSATYYFRLSTLSPSLMRDMHDSGIEASYHYEEVATVARQLGLRTAEQVNRELPRIRTMFKQNLLRLREQTGLPMVTVASHGDFINRKLGVTNTIILADKAIREDLGIAVEAYDDALNSSVTSRHADRQYPLYWYPDDPLAAIARDEPVIMILTHPRQWRAAPVENLSQDVGRLWQGVRYKVSTINPHISEQ